MLTDWYLCYSIVYHYNGVQWFKQFLQVRRLYRALILLCFALFHPNPLYLWYLWCYMTLKYFFTFCTLPFSELSLVGLSLDVVD